MTMDSGDIIYVILAIVFSAAGAFSKRKKSPIVKKKSSRLQEVFNELFDEETTEDPVQQMAAYAQEDVVLAADEIEQQPMTLMEEYHALMKKQPVKEAYEDREAIVEPDKQAQQPHHLLVNLKDKDELKKAIIYAEILTPKFKSL